MNDDYKDVLGGMVLATMMIISIVSALVGCLVVLGAQWLMRVMGY